MFRLGLVSVLFRSNVGVFGEQRNALILQVVTCRVHLLRQGLREFLCLLELHVEHLEHVVGKLEQENEDLFLAHAEERAVPLVEAQVSSL